MFVIFALYAFFSSFHASLVEYPTLLSTFSWSFLASSTVKSVPSNLAFSGKYLSMFSLLTPSVPASALLPLLAAAAISPQYFTVLACVKSTVSPNLPSGSLVPSAINCLYASCCSGVCTLAFIPFCWLANAFCLGSVAAMSVTFWPVCKLTNELKSLPFASLPTIAVPTGTSSGICTDCPVESL